MWPFSSKKREAERARRQAETERLTASAGYHGACLRRDTRDQSYWHQRLKIATANCLRVGA